MTRDPLADLTDLRSWKRDPALAGLLREWADVPAERLRAEADAWLDLLVRDWGDRGDLFATEPIGTAAGADKGYTAVCLSADGELFADGHPDGSVRIGEIRTLRAVASFVAHEGQVTALAFHPDGKLLATASRDRTAKLWAVETGTLIKRLTGHIDEVLSVAFHPTGNMMATTSRDGTVALWEVPSGAHLQGLVKWPPEYLAEGKEVHIFPVMCAAFGGDGRTLATGTSRNVVLWDLASLRECAVWPDHRGPVTAITYTGDGKRLVSGAQDRTLRVWDAAARRPLFALPNAAGPVQWLRVLGDGETVLGLVGQGALQVWHLGSRRMVTSLCPVSEPVTTVDHVGREELLCCGLENGEVRCFGLVGARLLLRHVARTLRVRKAHGPAARAFELLEDWGAAAEQFERSGDPFSAAQLFARAGQAARAGAAFQRAGAPEEAARAWRKAGDPLAAADAWAAAGRLAEAVPLYLAVLRAEGGERPAPACVAGWRLATLLHDRPTDPACVGTGLQPFDLARRAHADFLTHSPTLDPSEIQSALEALMDYGRAAGREAEVKEGFETVLRVPALPAATAVGLLEIYLRAATAFGNQSLQADLHLRLEAARSCAEREAASAEREREEERARAAAEPALPAVVEEPREPVGEAFSFLWHSRANAKCARLLHELARRFKAEVSLQVLKRKVPVQRFDQLSTFLSGRNVRGHEVTLRFSGEQAAEARRAFEELVRTNEAFV